MSHYFPKIVEENLHEQYLIYYELFFAEKGNR